MKYRYLVFAFFFAGWLVPFVLQAQQTEITMENIPITWNDFSIKNVRDKHAFDAITLVSYGIEGAYKYENKEGSVKLKFTFFAEMDKKQSYVRKSFLKTADSARSRALLDHERGHWIITMIYFRQLVKDMEQFTFTRRFKYQVDSILRNNYAACKKEQLRYDRETNHSKVKEQQKQWEADLLDRLYHAYGNEIQFPVRFSKEFEISESN